MLPRRFVLIGIVLWATTAKALAVDLPTCGDPDIDRTRAEVRATPTDADNFILRGFLMKLWVVALQQQGADLEPYLTLDDRMRHIVPWNTAPRDGKPQEYTPGQLHVLSALIDEGYAILEHIQQELAQGKASPPSTGAAPAKVPESVTSQGALVPWPSYKGNPQRTGYTGAPGPRYGVNAWKFPVGLAWESRPVIEDGRVYVASPGMRSILHCLDLSTGKPVWTSRQVAELQGDQLYNTPAIASTPVVLRDRVLVREMGSRGNLGPARHVVSVAKDTGNILGKIEAGHVDYRAGSAPLAANETYLITPYGVQDIEATPPTAQGFNRLICRSSKSGTQLWDFNIGPTFCQPVLVGNRVWAATRDGYIFCLKADGRFPQASAERIAWHFKAGGAVNQAIEVSGDAVFFGANDGAVYCLDRETGGLRWKQPVAEPEPRSFRQFSTPLVQDGRVFVGGADRHLHCLDAAKGKILFRVAADDWIRSRPVALGDRVFFATLKGTLNAIRVSRTTGQLEWSKPLGEHPIYADLAAANGVIVANTSLLYSYGVTEEGKILWRHSLLSGFEKDGTRIQTEQIAGGAYFQSKPTAAEGRVFFGTPSRFVHAADARTGVEAWRFELGAAVSGAPEYSDGRIYIGQQGGEDDFYCLDARTGRPIWSQALGWIWGSACVDGGQVFVPGIDGWANCLDARTGAILWRYRTERSVCTEPLVFGDSVCFGGWDHYLYVFNRHTGALRWKHHLGGGSDSGAPVFAEGRLYVPVGGSVFRCLDAKTGAELWRFQAPPAGFNISPSYHEGRVFVGLQRGLGLGGIQVHPVLCGLDAQTGEKLWTHVGGGLTGPVVGGDGRVYVASTASPFLYCLDPTGNGDGTTRLHWTYRLGNKVEESVPCLYGNYLYLLSCDGYLHAVR